MTTPLAWLKSASSRQAAQMTCLRFAALGIGAVAQIYAARQLGPEKLGISGMALAAVAQGSILVTLGANAMLVREHKSAESEEARESLVRVAFTLRCVVTLCLGLVIVAAAPLLWSMPQYLLATACVLPLIFFDSNQAMWVLQAEERVPAQFLANVASAVVSASVVFAFIRPGSPAGFDMVASVAGLIVAFLLSWRFARGRIPRLQLAWRKMGRMLSDSRWLFLSAVFTYLYTRFEQPLVGWLRSVEELGVYRSAWQITNAIQPFFGMVPLLLYPKLLAWREVSRESLWQGQKRVFFSLLPWCCLAAVGAFVLLPVIYPWIYGQAFAGAAIPCALLVTAKLVVILNGIFAYGLWAEKRDRRVLLIMVAVATASIGCNILAIPRFGITGAAVINLLSEVLILAACAYSMRPRGGLLAA